MAWIGLFAVACQGGGARSPLDVLADSPTDDAREATDLVSPDRPGETAIAEGLDTPRELEPADVNLPDALPDTPAELLADRPAEVLVDADPVETVPDLPDVEATGEALPTDVEIVSPPPDELPPTLLGYPSYTFEPKGSPKAVADLVQAFLDGGQAYLEAFAEARGIELWWDSVELMLDLSLAERSGFVSPADLVAAGGHEIGSYGAVGWFLVPVPGLVAILEDPTIDSLANAWLPNKPQIDPPLGGVQVELPGAEILATGASECHAIGIDGAGIRVAILDAGFKGYEDAIAQGYLPADTTIVEDVPGLELPDINHIKVHGTAVAEVVHRVAPGASLFLIQLGNADVALPAAIDWCIANGVDVINASWAYFMESFYDGTGPVSTEVQRAWDHGIVWVTSAGNYADGVHWRGTFQDADQDGDVEFDGANEENLLRLEEKQKVKLTLDWDQWGQAAPSDLDVCVHLKRYAYNDPTVTDELVRCTGVDEGEPHDELVLTIDNAAGCLVDPELHWCVEREVGVLIRYVPGASPQPAPGTALSLMARNLGAGQELQFHDAAGSVVDPAVLGDAIAVGAVAYPEWDAGTRAAYSSYGPTNAGLQKPELMGPAHVWTTIYDPFDGTSAAAPHVAGLAALILQEHPELAPSEVKARLVEQALPVAQVLPDPQTGFGKAHHQCVPCVPGCEGRECGPDGCGGDCGACGPDRVCDAVGRCACVVACDEDCCQAGETCHEGSCCEPSCDGTSCLDGCGGACACATGTYCGLDKLCYACSCEGKECGTNECGASCGDCGALVCSGHACVAHVLTVNTGDDLSDGACSALHCSLREAIEDANALPGKDRIVFAVPGVDSVVITPASPLPVLTEGLAIDATTQPGYKDTPVVELDGSLAGPQAHGLHVAADQCAIRGLAIGGFGGHGIFVDDAEACTVAASFLGTDLLGTVARANGGDGVHVYKGGGHLLGGIADRDGNLVSGNGRAGIGVENDYSTAMHDIVIQGNRIGTNRFGSAALPNQRDGIELVLARDVQIGGVAAGSGNQIAGNGRHGVGGEGHGVNLFGNLVGLVATGGACLGNGSDGINLTGSALRVGGTAEGTGNVVACSAAITTGTDLDLRVGGNGTLMIAAEHDLVVAHNVIGPDRDGVVCLSEPHVGGVTLGGGTNLVLDNVVACHATGQLRLDDNEGSVVQGNRIGTDATGMSALGTTKVGISLVGGAHVLLGGEGPGQGNVVSGHSDAGIAADASYNGGQPQGLTVTGNLIGTDLLGSTCLGAGSVGIRIFNHDAVVIGGATVASGNLVACHATGVSLTYVDDATLRNNRIGNVVAADGTIVGEQKVGVSLFDAHDVVVGGDTSAEGNVIAHNLEAGVLVKLDGTTAAITANRIHDNAGAGIRFATQAGTPYAPEDAMDVHDSDAGPNGLQNHPALLDARVDAGALTVEGMLASAPSADFRVDLYANAGCGAGGYGEGELHLGHVDLVTDTEGLGSFELVANAPQGLSWLSATATDSSGATSAFARCLAVRAGVAPMAVADAYSLPENQPAALDVLQNDAPPAAGPLALVALDTLLTAGSAVVSADGTTLEYAPPADWCGQDLVLYQVRESGGGVAWAPVILTVTPVNQAPVAGDDFVHMLVDTARLADVLANDLDADDDTLSIATVTEPQHGSAVLSGDGLLYTPDAGYQGVDELAYTVADGHGGFDTGVVRVMVMAPGPFVVTSSDDAFDGLCEPLHCSLREAMSGAASLPGPDVIDFAIPGPGPHVIALASALSPIDERLEIRGETQEGYKAVPAIELDGGQAGAGAEGLVVRASQSRISALAVGGFDGNGIRVEGAEDVVVTGCHVGADALGNQARPNHGYGVEAIDSDGLCVGGSGVWEGNVLSGNDGGGLRVLARDHETVTGLLVQGNLVGLDAYGTGALPNASGVTLHGGVKEALLGGSEPAARNVIAGNLEDGIQDGGSFTRIVGNFVGTDASGQTCLGNGGAGVHGFLAWYPVIGGALAGEGNVISCNDGDGILLYRSPGTRIAGNRIGTDGLGVSALPNDTGVHLEGGEGTWIGGVGPGEGNVISGNRAHGIRLEPSTNEVSEEVPRATVIAGNVLGASPSGDACLGNGYSGIQAWQDVQTTIGGETGAGNRIACNGSTGISLWRSHDARVVGNVIHANAGAGVAVGSEVTDTSDAEIVANEIHSNDGLGLDLGAAGVLPNDPLDLDEGPNRGQNHPLLAAATLDGATGILTISGVLEGGVDAIYTLHFYLSTACDPSGYGEGESYVGYTMLTTSAQGSVAIDEPFLAPEAFGAALYVTATATDGDGNTSEFSPCVPVACQATCDDKVCGDDGCGGECLPGCHENETCGEDGQCRCPGTACGEACCATGEVCFEGGCCAPTSCEGRACGDDGCGTSCGECLSKDPCLSTCRDGQCGPELLDEQACDHLDDDCDGLTDEDFKVGGIYAHPQHCGVCGNDCTLLPYDHAAGGSCRVWKGIAVCVPSCSDGWGNADHLSDDGCECEMVSRTDTVGDDVDQNCDGIDGTDDDWDGHASAQSGGGDCNDQDENVNPGAPDPVLGACVDWVKEWTFVDLPVEGAYDDNAVSKVDREGALHVCYPEHGTGKLKYLTNRSGSWETIDLAGRTGLCSDLVVDDDGHVHLLSGNLYLTNTSGEWASSIYEPSGCADYQSLAVDPGGVVHIAASCLPESYTGSGTLAYYTDAPGYWTKDVVVPQYTFSPNDLPNPPNDIAASGAGDVTIAFTSGYYSPYTGYAGHVAVAEKTQAAGWTTKDLAPTYYPIADEGAYLSLATNAQGIPYVAFHQLYATHDVQYVAHQDQASWTIETVTTGPSTKKTCVNGVIAIDSQGAAHMAYMEYYSSTMAYAANSSGAWNVVSLDPSFVAVLSNNLISISIDRHDRIHLTYASYDYSTASLRLRYAISHRCAGVDTLADSNCDGADGTDGDGDGAASTASGGSDCDDQDQDRHPGAADGTGDGLDSNCDGADGIDADRDGHASTASAGDDCDDEDAGTYPGALDLAGDGRDTDCDGDDGRDDDDDGHPAGYAGGDDCDDAEAAVHPGVEDHVGDAIDNNCDGIDGTDADGDGHASTESSGDDCDDGDAQRSPGAPDPFGDGQDTDCDGADGVDSDEDGYASLGSGGDDCDDDHPAIHPGAWDPYGDGIDSNCDGADAVDHDGDGYADHGSGGDDCDDADVAVSPAAVDHVAGTCVRTGRVFETTGLTPVGASHAGNLDLLIDPEGTSHLCFRNVTDKSLVYGTNAGGSWSFDVVEDSTADVGYYCSLGRDSAGRIHIAYYDGTNKDLKLAHGNPGAWTVDALDQGGGTAGVGMFCSLAVDSGDHVHVAYKDSATNSVMYATNRTGAWVSENISGASVGADRISMTLDLDDHVHVVFYYLGAKYNYYIHNASGSWSVAKIANTYKASGGNSLAAAGDGSLHLAFASGSYTLVHDALRGGTWSSATVDSTPYTGGSSSLGLDEQGKVHVSFYHSDSAFLDLRYGSNETGAWQVQVVDSDGYVGSSSAIAVKAGDVHILYADDTGHRLKYAVGAVTCLELGQPGDSNCDGVDGTDGDGDGHASLASGGDDCDDVRQVVYADAIEYCDSLDNDCDGEVDEGCCTRDCAYDGYGTDGCGGLCFLGECGNGVCDLSENTTYCPADCCGTCGDHVCADYDRCGETAVSCPQDCGGPACGDGACEPGEDPAACPSDCSHTTCGNGLCEPAEDKFGGSFCEADCAPHCGNCKCERTEDWKSCPADCGVCGDGVCNVCGPCDESDAGGACFCAADCTRGRTP